MSDDVLFERTAGVARITLNRAAVRNAVTPAMCTELLRIIESLRADPDTRVVLLRAAGTDFTVGADLKGMAGGLATDPAQRAREISAIARATSVPIFMGLQALPQPVVVSARGHAIGVGAQVLLSADLSIVSETARILLPQARLAHPVDHGESWFLPRRVGLARAMQLTLLAETVSGAEAERIGLVNWVVPDGDLDARTENLVTRLCDVAPVAVAQIKSLLRQSEHNDLGAQLEAEMQSLATCAATEDFPEALRAFVEKRKPAFRGR